MSSTAAAPHQEPLRADIVIVGGGLSGGLIAWRLAERRPDLNVLLVEGGERLGGNHTWSFHETDLPPAAREWIKPFISYAWDQQEVRFPRFRRIFDTPYRSITSERFDALIRDKLGPRVMSSVKAASVTADRVILEDQRVIRADAVIDARGQRPYDNLSLGFQKFVGLEVEFDTPHGLDGPIIMDATVPQLDGYRFVYVLPFSDRTALVEDTYYADGEELDQQSIEDRITDYCGRQGWSIKNVIRREAGVLPIALAGDIDAHLAEGTDGVSTVGLAAGLFHPLTGYSLPDAAALADLVAESPSLDGVTLGHLVKRHATDAWADRSFYRLLSRLLFDAASPDQRYKVMQRFYSLRRPLIERLYASRSTQADKFRILAGKPPVGIFKAIKCLDEPKWLARRREIS